VTDLVLVRHGETVWHSEDRYAGSSDIELTARGVAQAEALARWARSAGLSAVWSSQLSRAARTASHSASALGLSPVVDPRLRELDFGDAEGLTKSDLATAYPSELAAFRSDPVEHHLPAGESPVEAAHRFVACLRDIATNEPGARVLVVAHTTAIRLAVCHLIGIDLSRYRQVFPAVRNCALTEVRLPDRGGDASLLQFNTPVEGVHELSH